MLASIASFDALIFLVLCLDTCFGRLFSTAWVGVMDFTWPAFDLSPSVIVSGSSTLPTAFVRLAAYDVISAMKNWFRRRAFFAILGSFSTTTFAFWFSDL